MQRSTAGIPHPNRQDTRRRRMSRRSVLKTSLMFGTAGLSLPQLLRAQEESTTVGSVAKDTAVIQIWLGGGISQFESWDPKPNAPEEIRGPWKPIATKLPGVQFCELLPRQAQLSDRMAIIRNVRHRNSGHAGATTICATGKPLSTEPSTGSIAAKMCGPVGFGVPAYVQMKPHTTYNPTFGENFYARYLGARYDPFDILADPSSESFTVPNVTLTRELSLERLDDRQRLCARLDRLAHMADFSSKMSSLDHFNQSAFEMIGGPRTSRAFDLKQENPRLRERYGLHRWGQSALLARRLVEAGVRFVTINTGPAGVLWDIHGGTAGTVGPTMQWANWHMDQMVSTLIEDLYARGLDQKVLLLIWGEFGRTPIINKRAGRDHWPNVGSLALVGGGFRMGQVIGASDEKGAQPGESPIRPQDVLATMYHHLGINPKTLLYTQDGRPTPILSEGKIISQLL